MVKLEAGVKNDPEWKRCNTVADCPDPKPNSWPIDTIVTLVAKPFSEKAGPR
jgi:glycine betaine/proline transport system substrate-binding protein